MPEAKKVVPVEMLGEYDFMVVIRTKGDEMAFVMNFDSGEDAFVETCKALRKSVSGEKP